MVGGVHVKDHEAAAKERDGRCENRSQAARMWKPGCHRGHGPVVLKRRGLQDRLVWGSLGDHRRHETPGATPSERAAHCLLSLGGEGINVVFAFDRRIRRWKAR